MKIHQIIYYPAQILSKRSSDVEEITKEWHALIPEMVATMYENAGIGLAGPQVNIPKRIIIVKDKEKDHAFFNAKILSKSKETEVEEEGCLSLPGIFVSVKRAKNVVVAAQLPSGETVQLNAQGLVARIFQHEIDHLNGKLIINRLSPLQRFKIRGKLRKFKKPT